MNKKEVKYMKNKITECIQISLIILSVAIGIAMPNVSIMPIGDLNYAFWFMFIGLILPISLGILLSIQTFSEKPQAI
jgi:hypothetical protein